jgi:hypothetical protein
MAERDDTITEIFVGAAVVLAAVGFFVYAASSAGGMSGNAGAYELSASFRSAEGIGVGTEVRLAGVRVGTVTGMELDPESFRAETTFTVAGNLELPDDSPCRDRVRGASGRHLRRDHPRRLALRSGAGGRDPRHAKLGQPDHAPDAVRWRRGRIMRRARFAAMLALGLVGASALPAQQFDNFGETTLPEGPGILPEGSVGQEDALNLPWLDGQAVILPPAENGVAIGPGRPGQNGGLVERFPGTSAPVTSVSQPVTQQGARVTLRALDRMLGRPTDIELTIGQTVLFGRIAIHVPECRYPADNPSSDAYAHIRVLDTGGNQLFDGWMVASSPALSALEHPRYDVWVLRCANTS